MAQMKSPTLFFWDFRGFKVLEATIGSSGLFFWWPICRNDDVVWSKLEFETISTYIVFQIYYIIAFYLQLYRQKHIYIYVDV